MKQVWDINNIQKYSDNKYGLGKYTILKKYRNEKNKCYIEIMCNKGHVFSVRLENFLSGKFVCKECNKFERMIDFFYWLITNRFEDIECLNPRDYEDEHKKLWFRCKECGYVWDCQPNHIKNWSGCPKCSEKYHYTDEEWHKMIEPLRPDIDFSLAHYINNSTPVHLKCKDCGFEWYAAPNNIKRGTKCPNCYNKWKLEEDVKNALIKNNIEFSFQYKENCFGRQSLDFFINKIRIGIECQGIQHFEPRDLFGGVEGYKDCIKRDERKNKICKDNNIILLYYTDIVRDSYPYPIYLTVESLIEKIKEIIKEYETSC